MPFIKNINKFFHNNNKLKTRKIKLEVWIILIIEILKKFYEAQLKFFIIFFVYIILKISSVKNKTQRN